MKIGKVYNSNGVYPGTPISADEKRKNLYHYTSFETFVKIWLSGYLRFGETTKVNDIIESHKQLSVENPQQMDIYKKKIKEFRQISLTMDFDSYRKGCMSEMLWGHYGDKGGGVCLQIDYDRLNLSNCICDLIEYKDYIPATPIMPFDADVDSFIQDNIHDLFFVKTDDWKGENEFKIISNKLIQLDISNAVTGVYTASPWTDECHMVEELVGKENVQCLRFYKGHDDFLVPTIVNTNKYRKSCEPRELPQNVTLDLSGNWKSY